MKEGEIGRGDKSSKCQTPFYDIQNNNILHISGLLITTSTQYLKWNYRKIKLKKKFSTSSFSFHQQSYFIFQIPCDTLT